MANKRLFEVARDHKLSADALMALVNGQRVDLPSGEVRLRVAELDDRVDIVGNELAHPVEFDLSPASETEVESWAVRIRDASGTFRPKGPRASMRVVGMHSRPLGPV